MTIQSSTATAKSRSPSDGLIALGALGRNLEALLTGPARDLVEVPFAADAPVSVMAVPDGCDGLPDHLRNWGGAAASAPTREGAAIACLFEVAERCSQMLSGTEKVVPASYRDIRDRAVAPSSLIPFSARQGSIQLGAAPLAWTAARRMDGTGERWLPAEFVFRRARPSATPWPWPAESNGSAAGTTFDDAVRRGFLEAVERDAVAIWWFNRASRPSIPKDIAEIVEIRTVERWQRAHGRQLQLLDLTTDLGIPVVAAVSHHNSGRGIALGFAADFSPHRAAVRAIGEMLQFHAMVNLSLALRPDHGDAELGHHTSAARSWFATVAVADERYLLPDAEAPRSPAIAQVEAHAVPACLAICEKHRLMPLVVDLTRDWIGVPVARVIVPGLRSLKRHLGPGRLYEVPVDLGWRRSPISEDEVNPRQLPV